jgi:hypothetical protein
MDGKPDFRYEKSALGHAACLLTIFLLVGWIVHVVPLPADGEVGGRDWERWLTASTRIFGLAVLTFWLASFVALAIKGGVFRVVIQDGRLRVQSPFRLFGTSFDLALPEIQRLVRREQAEGPILYEIHTHAGGVVLLPYSGFGFMPYHVANAVFATLHRLHPEIPIEWQPWGGREHRRSAEANRPGKAHSA